VFVTGLGGSVLVEMAPFAEHGLGGEGEGDVVFGPGLAGEVADGDLVLGGLGEIGYLDEEGDRDDEGGDEELLHVSPI
jgi:hypothetical protein